MAKGESEEKSEEVSRGEPKESQQPEENKKDKGRARGPPEERNASDESEGSEFEKDCTVRTFMMKCQEHERQIELGRRAAEQLERDWKANAKEHNDWNTSTTRQGCLRQTSQGIEP